MEWSVCAFGRDNGQVSVDGGSTVVPKQKQKHIQSMGGRGMGREVAYILHASLTPDRERLSFF